MLVANPRAPPCCRAAGSETGRGEGLPVEKGGPKRRDDDGVVPRSNDITSRFDVVKEELQAPEVMLDRV